MGSLHAIRPDNHATSYWAIKKSTDLPFSCPVFAFCCCHCPLEWVSFSASSQLWNEEGGSYLVLWISLGAWIICVHMCFEPGEKVHRFLHVFQAGIPNILSRSQIFWFSGYLEIAFSRQNDSGIDSSWMIYFPPYSKTIFFWNSLCLSALT